MNIFPTQYSLLSAKALKDVIEKEYGFHEMSCRLLIHNVSDTYILENTDAKYVFKIYRDAHRKLEEIKGELELLNILKQGGANVSHPVKDLEGNEIQAFNAAEGTRYGVLFSYAYGEVVADMTDDQLTVLGTEMAKMHQLTANLELGYPRGVYSLNSMLTLPMETIKPAFKGLEEEYTYLQEAVSLVYDKMERMDLDSFAYGYCHYDFLPKNFHFQENGMLTFFDFDFAGKGHLVNDLASFYAHYFLQVLFNRMTQEEADRAFQVFLEGYRKIRPLSETEVSAIPYFGFAWWIFYFKFHYDHFEDWSNFFFGPKFIKERVGWIKKWMDWYIVTN